MAELYRYSVFFANQAYKQDYATVIAFLIGLVDVEWRVLVGSGGPPGHVRHSLSSASGAGHNA